MSQELDTKPLLKLLNTFVQHSYVWLPSRAAGTYRGRGDSPKFYEILTLPFKYLLILLNYKISLNHVPTKNFNIPTALPNTKFILHISDVRRQTCDRVVILYIFDVCVQYISHQEIESVIDHTSENKFTPDRKYVGGVAAAAAPPPPLHAFVAAYYYSRPPGRDDDSEKYQGSTLTIHFPGSSLPSSVFIRCLNLHWPFLGGGQIMNIVQSRALTRVTIQKMRSFDF